MSYRFVTKSVHAYLIDYPFAISLLAADLSQRGFRLLPVSRRCS
jgi:hypothetical protein